ncbi:hypothetical protein IGI04_008185 [Brassica rapa subsp. trilocularis]|uniref:Uncharacterized protein n=1 Tax=Brassica rapa subsp. trilocularis TaxID=1813537 RepID=A0ABQ7NN20_BRACM|nr:hypothetical protein IGI04_008185 [Brassica rapa subsp. trilocularis]
MPRLFSSATSSSLRETSSSWVSSRVKMSTTVTTSLPVDKEAFPPGRECSGLLVIYEQCVRSSGTRTGTRMIFVTSKSGYCEWKALCSKGAKSMKFKVSYMVSSGQPTKEYFPLCKFARTHDTLHDVVIIHAPKGKYVNSATA